MLAKKRELFCVSCFKDGASNAEEIGIVKKGVFNFCEHKKKEREVFLNASSGFLRKRGIDNTKVSSGGHVSKATVGVKSTGFL
mgnify:CR=1 FL=1